jgi:hypothetical protein
MQIYSANINIASKMAKIDVARIYQSRYFANINNYNKHLFV